MTISLNTPEQINHWVLLSRRQQVQLHLKGLKVKGIMAALKRDIPGCENITRVSQAVLPIEEAISFAGGEADFNLVNVHVCRKHEQGVLSDRGIFATMAEVEADEKFVKMYNAGVLEIMLTDKPVREKTNDIYVVELP